MYIGTMAPSGRVGLQVIRGPRQPQTATPPKELTLREILWHGRPHADLPAEVYAWRQANLLNLWRGMRRVMAARVLRLPHFYGQLSLVVIRADGTWLDYGLASLRVVTDAGVNYIVDAFQNTTELENLKYHGLGTGSTAEAAEQTALVTELTTEYNPNSTRATGTTTEGASANIYRTVGVNTLDGAAAIQEHGIFSQAATGGGTMLDRSVFSVINLASGDSLSSTFDLSLSSGG